jgi:hypothetical protein
MTTVAARRRDTMAESRQKRALAGGSMEKIAGTATKGGTCV